MLDAFIIVSESSKLYDNHRNTCMTASSKWRVSKITKAVQQITTRWCRALDTAFSGRGNCLRLTIAATNRLQCPVKDPNRLELWTESGDLADICLQLDKQLLHSPALMSRDGVYFPAYRQVRLN